MLWRMMGDNRPPVSTIDQAVWWLVGNSLAIADFIDGELSVDDMPPEACLVCDVFWVTRETLRRKLISAFLEIDTRARPKVTVQKLRRWA